MQQDNFLRELKDKDALVHVFLINGIKLIGKITTYDRFSIFLENNGKVQMVYKHSVSTVMPYHSQQQHAHS